MNLINSRPPHIRSRESNFSVMGDMVIALIPLYFMAFFFYGSQVAVLGGVSVLTCVLLDVACTYISGRKVGVLDLSPVVTGLMIPLMLPASISLYVVVVADLFAIGVVKQPFGGLGQNIFNPAAAGVAFAALTWKTEVFSYPMPIQSLGNTTARLVTSPAASLKIGATPNYTLMDMVFGIYPGPMGATGILILTACLVYLVVRRTVNAKMTLTFLGVAAVIAFLFPRITTGRLESVFFELTSGILLFGSIFLINEPTTAPKAEVPKLIYAGVSGAVVMLFRYAGVFEEGMFFAVILMNAFSWLIDMKYEERKSAERRARYAADTTETI